MARSTAGRGGQPDARRPAPRLAGRPAVPAAPPASRSRHSCPSRLGPARLASGGSVVRASCARPADPGRALCIGCPRRGGSNHPSRSGRPGQCLAGRRGRRCRAASGARAGLGVHGRAPGRRRCRRAAPRRRPGRRSRRAAAVLARPARRPTRSTARLAEISPAARALLEHVDESGGEATAGSARHTVLPEDAATPAEELLSRRLLVPRVRWPGLGPRRGQPRPARRAHHARARRRGAGAGHVRARRGPGRAHRRRRRVRGRPPHRAAPRPLGDPPAGRAARRRAGRARAEGGGHPPPRRRADGGPAGRAGGRGSAAGRALRRRRQPRLRARPTSTTPGAAARPPTVGRPGRPRGWPPPRLPGLVGTRDAAGKAHNALSPENASVFAAETRRMALDAARRRCRPARCWPPAPARPPWSNGSPGCARAGRVRALTRWPGRCGRRHVLGVLALGGVPAYARALLAGDDAAPLLAPLLPEPVDHVLLQADLTAVAPGPLEPELARRLQVAADVESRGGATVYRFTGPSVRRALDLGWTAAELHAFVGERVPHAGAAAAHLPDRRHRPHLRHRPRRPRRGVRPRRRRGRADRAAAPPAGRPRSGCGGSRRPCWSAPRRSTCCSPGCASWAPRPRSRPPTARCTSPGPTPCAPARRSSAGTQERATRESASVARVVAAIRAGDRAVAERPAAGRRPALTPGDSMTALRQAVAARASVLIGYVDNHGTSTERIVDPLGLEGGHADRARPPQRGDPYLRRAPDHRRHAGSLWEARAPPRNHGGRRSYRAGPASNRIGCGLSTRIRVECHHTVRSCDLGRLHRAADRAGFESDGAPQQRPRCRRA